MFYRHIIFPEPRCWPLMSLATNSKRLLMLLQISTIVVPIRFQSSQDSLVQSVSEQYVPAYKQHLAERFAC